MIAENDFESKYQNSEHTDRDYDKHGRVEEEGNKEEKKNKKEKSPKEKQEKKENNLKELWLERLDSHLSSGVSYYEATNVMDHLNHEFTVYGTETMNTAKKNGKLMIKILKRIINKHPDTLLIVCSDHGGDQYIGQSVTDQLHGPPGIIVFTFPWMLLSFRLSMYCLIVLLCCMF
jgi:hypothetical protein